MKFDEKWAKNPFFLPYFNKKLHLNTKILFEQLTAIEIDLSGFLYFLISLSGCKGTDNFRENVKKWLFTRY